MTRPLKNPHLHQLVRYINGGRESFEQESLFILQRNTLGVNSKQVSADFRVNNHHIRARKGRQVGVQHWVLSFHPKEKQFLNTSKLYEVAEKFSAKIDGDKAIIFARPHIEKDNIHLHFMVSASEVGSGKSRRISKTRLKEIQINMNRWQQKTFPELKHSLLYLPELKKSRKIFGEIPLPEKLCQTDGSVRVKKRGQESVIETLKSKLMACGMRAKNSAEFLQLLKFQGLESYQYRDKINGFMYQGKKYRFRRFGLELENIKAFVKQAQLEKQREKSVENNREPFNRTRI